MLVSKPVLAASIVATALVYLGYLWYSQRKEEREGVETPDRPFKNGTELQLDQVQEKLNCIKRSRLDTLEEEPNQSELGSVPVSEAQADTKDETAIEEVVSEERTNCSQAVFACTDIRYRHLEVNSTSEKKSEHTDSEVVSNIETVFECEKVIEQATVEEVIIVQEVAVTDIESKMAVDDTPNIMSPSKIPDVLSALKDPICSPATPPSPHSYSSSPVKSETSESKSSSCEWSDLIEQDERELQEFQLDSKVLSSKLSGLELVGGGRSGDSGVVSPSEEDREDKLEKKSGKNKSRTQSGEDAGIGSDQGDESGAYYSEINYEETQLLAYHFHIPDYLCGKLIGHNGTFIKKLKEDCCVNIILKETVGEKKKRKPKSKKDQKFGEGKLKLCCIEGTRINIDKCLDIVKDKFYHNPEMTFEQVNRSRGEGQNQMNLNGSVCLSLAEGVMHDVFVSSIVGGGHVFLQQPYHPTFFALERLDQCMTKTYSQFTCPQVPQPVELNSVCVAPCEEGWYRCQVVAYDSDTKMCDIKYLDYGGYHSLPAADLRQIRTDFLSLPFQAIECYLANINPTDDENISAFVLEELIAQQVVQARMIGTNEQGVPMIHLYRAVNGQTTMVNRELVDRSCAQWLDTTIVKLESPLEHPGIN